jgi:hypothetical protein
MRPFEPKTYMAEVLAPRHGSADMPGLFDRYLLDVEDADEAAIKARMEEVRLLWNKKSEHPKYGSMIRLLLEQHSMSELTLLDSRAREGAVEEANRERLGREEESRRGIEEWEGLLDQVAQSPAGLDPTRRARLEKMAAAAGIAPDVATRKLDAIPAASAPQVMDPGQRATIAEALRGLARMTGDRRDGLSLFHAFGLEPDAELDMLARRRDEKLAELARGGHTEAKATWDRVASLAKTHLLDGDPRAYSEGLLADVQEALEGDAIRAVADDEVIDEVEAEQLQRKAIELGLTAEMARQVVAELARENGAVVRVGPPVDLVVCPSCNTAHARAAGHEHCSRCRAPLFVSCPGCEERNDATASICRVCGTDLYRHVEATLALNRIDAMVAGGQLARAAEQLRGAIQALGTAAAGVSSAEQVVRRAVGAADECWAQVEKARRGRREYEARRHLQQLAKIAVDYQGPAGELPNEALAAVTERIREADDVLHRARGLSGAQREATLVAALGVAADCVEAQRELDKLPPEPPTQVEAAVDGTAVNVRWTASPTQGVTYEIARTGADELVVGTTENLTIADLGAPSGALVEYRVAALRGRARSAIVSTPRLVAAHEVGDLTVISGDGEVHLSWTANSAAGRVRVHRHEDGCDADVEVLADAAGLTDGDVLNGRRYTYTVQVEYAVAGEIVRTPGQAMFAAPAERPLPLRHLNASGGPNGVRVDFQSPAAGTVVVLRCDGDPELELGAELDPAELSRIGRRLKVTGSTATDDDPPSGRCFYQALTVAAGVAVAGTCRSFVSLPLIENVSAQPNGSEVRVTWTWPDQIKLARVVWRTDRLPAGPEDPDAAALDYRIGEYKDRGGCSIETGESASLFVAVYPAARIDGEVAFGSGGKGSRDAVRQKQKTAVRYAVRRAGRLNNKRLEIEVNEPVEGDLPELVLVGREGEILPRTTADGTVLARLGGSEGDRTSTLELRGLSRPIALRLFLGSAGAASGYVLFDPMADDLMIA